MGQGVSFLSFLMMIYNALKMQTNNLNIILNVTSKKYWIYT